MATITIYDIDPTELIKAIADELKKIEVIKAPDWAAFCKTGHSKERPPVQKDWWYTRIASILRLVYKLGPIGVSKLRTKYGSKKNRGYKKDHFYKGSGNIIRKSLQQLEAAELIKKGEKGVHKGRILTKKGKQFLDNIAAKLATVRPQEKHEEKKPEANEPPKKEEKGASPKEAKTDKPKEAKKKPKEKKEPAPQEGAKPEQKNG